MKASLRPFDGAVKGAMVPLIVAVVAGLVIAAAGLLVPLYVRVLFDVAYPTHDIRLLFIISAVSVGTVLLLLGVSALRDQVVLLAEQHILRRLYHQFDRHVLQLPVVALRLVSPGTLTVRFTSDLDQIGSIFVRIVPGLIENAFRLLALTFFCGWMAPILTAVIWVSLPIQLAVSALFKDKIAQIQAKAQQLSAQVYDGIQSQMAAIKLIRIFQTRAIELRQLDAQISKVLANEQSAFKTQTAANLATAGIQQLWTAVLMVLTGILIVNGKLSIGQGVAMASYIAMFASPFQGIVLAFRQFTTAMVSVQNINAILQIPVTPEPNLPPQFIEQGGLHVVFDEVSFSYPGGTPVLTDFSLELPPNTCTVMVGPSGVGKSTVIELLLGLLTPRHGQIRIQNLGAHLLSESGVVLQNPYLIPGTIRENLAYGLSLPPTDIEIAQALDATDCTHWVSAFDYGVDTRVGSGGTPLSPGQQQRLTIARALLRKPRLLVLDEATSALDSVAERAIATTLKALKSRCTVLVVAHRLTALHYADNVVVIEAPGKVTEQGSVSDLVKKRGAFYKLLQLQTGGFDGFLDRLQMLIKLTERYHRPLSLIVGRPVATDHDPTAEMGLGLREVDLIACRDNGDLWIALPETAFEGAQAVAKRLSGDGHLQSARILEYVPDWGIDGIFKAAEGAPHD